MYFDTRDFFFVCLFFSAKTSLFPHCPQQLMFEVLKRGGKLIGFEADCKYVCLPPAVSSWVLQSSIELSCLDYTVGVID